jgi:hypothetical protein
LRCVDFEAQAAPGPEVPAAKVRDVFMANTRSMFLQCITYTASIHLAWKREANHKRVSPSSCSFLQCTRQNLMLLSTAEIDPTVRMVAVILDMTTDKGHLHLVAPAADLSQLEESIRDLLNDDQPGHVVPPAEVVSLAAELAARRSKDAVSHESVAATLRPLAERCAAQGKYLHVLATGCNTIQLAPPLKARIPQTAQPYVWLLCTSEVWPSDLATFLWNLYGSLAQPDDLTAFRQGTRELLGEYTDHYKRQRIEDPALTEHGLHGSLADAVHCARLDTVQIVGTFAQMDLL